MITVDQVKEAADQVFGRIDSWGFDINPIVIDDQKYVVEWIKDVEDDDDDWTHPTLAVFKVDLEGKSRYFAKRGLYRSHYGYEWNGEFFETYPTQVTKTEFVNVANIELTADDVEKALTSHYDWENWEEFAWDVVRREGNVFPKVIDINNVTYEVKMIDDGPDVVGEWSYDTYIIFSVGDRVFKKTGHFQSHYGNDWDGPLKQVVEVEKTVKVWEEV